MLKLIKNYSCLGWKGIHLLQKFWKLLINLMLGINVSEVHLQDLSLGRSARMFLSGSMPLMMLFSYSLNSNACFRYNITINCLAPVTMSLVTMSVMNS